MAMYDGVMSLSWQVDKPGTAVSKDEIGAILNLPHNLEVVRGDGAEQIVVLRRLSHLIYTIVSRNEFRSCARCSA